MQAKTDETTSIRFGTEGQWSLPGKFRVSKAVPAVEDLRAGVRAALESPLDLPAMDQIIVPGDMVVLAVDSGLPCLPSVVAFVAEWLHEKGTELSNIRVVLACNVEALRQETCDCFASLGLEAVEVELHDADDAQKVAYVAANEESDPIYLNRLLVDADVVIPISSTRHAASLDYLGAFSTFPHLSNHATLVEFLRPSRLDNSKERAKLVSWADQAAWWLGILAGVQIIPAEGNGVACALAGLLQPLEEAAQKEFASRWSSDDKPSDLVIALLDGNSSQQSWHHVAKALRNATRFVSHGGSIALCTQVTDAAGKGLRRLRDPHHTAEEIAAKLANDTSDDALPASIILELTRDYHVYFASQLRRETVESLGMGVLENETQLANLVSQHGSSVVLSSAQHRS